MRTLRSALRCYGAAAGTSLRERSAYLMNFGAGMLTYGLFIFIFSRVWAGAYAGKGEIAGYTNSMAIWYFIVAEVTHFGMGHFFQAMARDMKSGQVAYLLSRPYDFVHYHYAEHVGGSMSRFGLIVAEGHAIGLLFAGAPPALASGAGLFDQAGRALCTLVSLLLAGSLNFMLQFALSLSAFWLEENDALYWIYQKLALVVGTLVPLEFLPAAAVRVAVWTPFPYLSYAPARIFVAFSWQEALSLLSRQTAWLVLAYLLARLVFARGSRSVSVNGG